MRKLVSYIIFCKRISPDLHTKLGCSRLSHSTNQVDFLEVRSIKRERKLLEAGFLTAVRRCQLARKGEKKIENQIENLIKAGHPSWWDYLMEGQTIHRQ